MNQLSRLLLSAILPAIVFAPLLAVPAEAQTGEPEIALVHRLFDDQVLNVARATGEALEGAQIGLALNGGDRAVTSASSRAAIRFTDDLSLVRMNPNTVLTVSVEGDRGALTRTLEMEGGEIWARITGREGTRTQVRTPAGVAAVRGTDFIVRVNPETGETTVITLEGVLDFFSGVGEVEIPANHRTVVGSSDEVPESEPISAAELEEFRQLIHGDDESDADTDTVDLTVPGTGGTTLGILGISRSALQRILSGGGP